MYLDGSLIIYSSQSSYRPTLPISRRDNDYIHHLERLQMLKCMFSCLWFDRPIAAHFPRSILQVLGHGSCAFSFWIFCLISKENKYIFMLDLALGESSQQYKDQIFDAPCLPGTKWHQTRNILSGLRWIIYNLIRTKVSFYRDFYRGVEVEVGRSSMSSY